MNYSNIYMNIKVMSVELDYNYNIINWIGHMQAGKETIIFKMIIIILNLVYCMMNSGKSAVGH